MKKPRWIRLFSLFLLGLFLVSIGIGLMEKFVWEPERSEPPFEPGLLEFAPQEEQQEFFPPLTFLEILGPAAVRAAMTDCPSGTPTVYLLWCLRASGTIYTRSEFHEAISLLDSLAQDVNDIIATGTTLQEAYLGGKLILLDGTGTSNGITIGTDGDADGNCDGTGGDQCRTIYVDGSLGSSDIISPAAPLRLNASSGQDIIFSLNGSEMAQWDTSTSQFLYSNAGRPTKAVEVQGHEFGAVTYAEAALVANKPVTGYFTVTDANTDGFDFDFRPEKWDAGTVTVNLCASTTDATPTGNLVFTCSGNSVSDTEVVPDRTTTGEQAVTLGFGSSSQYDEECAPSTAITINSSPTAGDHIYMHCDVDATLTTVDTISAMRTNAMAKVFYTVTGE